MTGNPDRARDERDLSVIRLRAARVPFAAIASRTGTRPEHVHLITAAIKSADLHESGEPREQVMTGYWGT